METRNKMAVGDYDLPQLFSESIPSSKGESLKISSENLSDLKAIQKVYLIYEDERLTLDEVLARVLEFYRKAVPYRKVQP